MELTELSKIAILLPTRNARPSLKKAIESWKETTSGLSDLILIIDNDQADMYYDIGIANEAIYIDRMNLCPKLNKVSNWVDHYKVVGFVADDVVFQTKGWEERIIEKINEIKGIAYCNDLLQGEHICNNFFVHSDIIKILGYMAPPGLQHYYLDNFWKDLGLRLGRIYYFPDIIIEHRHWSNEKAEKDELYAESEKLQHDDHVTYDDYVLSGELEKDVNRLKGIYE